MLSPSPIGYPRGQSASVSPRGYGSNGSTPHSSNGSSYTGPPAINGYGSTSLGSMGMTSTANDFLPGSTSEQILPIIKSEAF